MMKQFDRLVEQLLKEAPAPAPVKPSKPAPTKPSTPVKPSKPHPLTPSRPGISPNPMAKKKNTDEDEECKAKVTHYKQ